jgi:hypothetical protein
MNSASPHPDRARTAGERMPLQLTGGLLKGTNTTSTTSQRGVVNVLMSVRNFHHR